MARTLAQASSEGHLAVCLYDPASRSCRCWCDLGRAPVEAPAGASVEACATTDGWPYAGAWRWRHPSDLPYSQALGPCADASVMDASRLLERASSRPLDVVLAQAGLDVPQRPFSPDPSQLMSCAAALACGLSRLMEAGDASRALAVRSRACRMAAAGAVRADSTSAKVACAVLGQGPAVADFPAVSLWYPFADGARDAAQCARQVLGDGCPAVEAIAAMAGADPGDRGAQRRFRALDRSVRVLGAEGLVGQASLGGAHAHVRGTWSGEALSVDFSSYYPWMLINMEGLSPAGAAQARALLAEKDGLSALAERAATPEAASSLLLDRAAVKLVLNAASGACALAGTRLYQPARVLSLRLVGQLVSLMLAQRLADAGLELVALNTDGLYCAGDAQAAAQVASETSQWCRVPIDVHPVSLVSADVNQRLTSTDGWESFQAAGPTVAHATGWGAADLCRRPALADMALARYVVSHRGSLDGPCDADAMASALADVAAPMGDAELVAASLAVLAPSKEGPLALSDGEGHALELPDLALRAMPSAAAGSMRVERLAADGSCRKLPWVDGPVLPVQEAPSSLSPGRLAQLARSIDTDAVCAMAASDYESTWRRKEA